MKRRNSLRFNVKMTMLFVSLFFLFICIKLVYVSVSNDVDGINLTAFASNRNTEKRSLYASRGSIYYNNGRELATDVNSYTVIAYLSESRTKNSENPEHVVDKEYTAEVLSSILERDKETLLGLLNRDKYQVELKRGISENDKNKILALDLPGLDFVRSVKRYYPNGRYASFILGYAKANDEGEINGEMGLEYYYNDILKGKNGSIEYQKDAYGYQIPNTPVIEEKSVSGNNIYLTLDEDIQHILENSIGELKKNYTYDWATLSIMNAKTGAILGSASSPNFDLNSREDLDSYLNPLVSYQYEPGSVMKIFSFMDSIESGKYDGTKTFQSGHYILSDGTQINDYNNVGWGEIDFDTGFAFSSNVAATILGLDLGAKNLRSFYDTLGFGKKTGIELPSEADGKITFTYESEVATASFGQGITVTPIQMLQALTTVANDGVMIKPYIVSKIVDENGKVIEENGRTEVAKVASKKTTDKIKELMHKVVYDVKSNNKFAPDNVTLIGKTGTAQIASPQGGYLKGEYDYIKSFAGLFPYEDPEYIVFISIKQIVGGTADVAGIVQNVVEETAKTLKIVNTISDEDHSKIIALSNYISKQLTTTVEELKNKGLNPIVLGEGKYIINQYPLNNEEVLMGAKVILLTNDTTYKMPDIIGWSTNEVVTLCNMLGLPYELTGKYGKVKTMNIIPGEVIDKTTPLVVELSDE